MSRVVFLNGEYKDYINALTHVEDRGYQFADGVYEVFSVKSGKLIDYNGHISRLTRSLNEIKIKYPINNRSILFHMRNIIRKNLIVDGLIYLQITRGVAKRDFKFPTNSNSTITIIGNNIPSDEYDISFERGINVVTTRDLRWKRVDIKSLNLLAPVLAKQFAYENNAKEAWMIDDNGYITEGSSSNAWVLIGKTVYTRPVSSSILNGITRKTLLKGLNKHGYSFKEKKFNMNDIRKSKEAYITSATQYVMPVVKVNNKKIGDGKVGKFAKIFREIYLESVQLKS